MFPLSQIEQHQSLSNFCSKVPFSHALMIALSSTTSPCVSATFSLEMVLLKLRANGHCKAFSQLLTTVPRKHIFDKRRGGNGMRMYVYIYNIWLKVKLLHQYLALKFGRIPETNHYSSCYFTQVWHFISRLCHSRVLFLGGAFSSTTTMILLMEDFRRSPVEVGSLSHDLQGLKKKQVVQDFFHQQNHHHVPIRW